jgi:hypothetical protein
MAGWAGKTCNLRLFQSHRGRVEQAAHSCDRFPSETATRGVRPEPPEEKWWAQPGSDETTGAIRMYQRRPGSLSATTTRISK